MDEYGNKRVKNESTIKVFNIEKDQPTKFFTRVKSNIVVDETEFIQYGQLEEEEFTTIEFSDPEPYGAANFPSKYVIATFFIELSMD